MYIGKEVKIAILTLVFFASALYAPVFMKKFQETYTLSETEMITPYISTLILVVIIGCKAVRHLLK